MGYEVNSKFSSCFAQAYPIAHVVANVPYVDQAACPVFVSICLVG